jgi:hypothetical protein
MNTRKTLNVAFAGLLTLGSGLAAAQDPSEQFYRWTEVSGTGIHYFDNSMLHAEEEIPRGVRKYVTETVELFGDLNGRVLYQPVSSFYLDEGKLVNRGNQVFSGTVLGVGPVMLHDDAFRFEVDLETGATSGRVFLMNRIAGPMVRCRLDIVGTGMTPEGNGLAEYTGQCRMFPDENTVNRW